MVPYGQGGTAVGVPPRTLLLAAVGVAGVAACITMVFLGMRAVMDVGGACANGGPYVSAQSCPNGAPGALILGILGLLGFGGLGMVFGPRVGGLWTAMPILAWAGLFLALGWNFLDYGLFNPPPGSGVEAGWLVPGVLFVLMGGVPLVLILLAARSGTLDSSLILASFNLSGASPVSSRLRRSAQPSLATPTRDSGADVAPDVDPDVAPDRLELVRHLEHLGEMRTQGLLDEAEYATAKAAVVHQMEGQQ